MVSHVGLASAGQQLSHFYYYYAIIIIITIIVIEGLSLLQNIPPTTANKQTQALKKRGSMARKLLGDNAKSYRLKLKLSRLVSTSTDCPPASTGGVWQYLRVYPSST